MVMLRLGIIFISQQGHAFLPRLAVVELLIVRQGLGGIQNVHRARHVFVDQANQLEVAGHREDDGKLLTLAKNSGRDTAGAVKSCRTGRKSRASRGKEWPHLTISQERECMSLVNRHRPGDGVASVNPNLVRQESQALPSEIVTLGSDCSI